MRCRWLAEVGASDENVTGQTVDQDFAKRSVCCEVTALLSLENGVQAASAGGLERRVASHVFKLHGGATSVSLIGSASDIAIELEPLQSLL